MATYREVFRVGEFRYLFAGQVLSALGDQLAAIAAAVLVFDRTGSGLWTAVAYASAWLPGLVGGPLLGIVADRWPRRTVLVVCDLLRAAVMVLLALTGIPLWAAVGLLYLAHLIAAPFSAARSALMPEVVAGDAYVTANGLGNITMQVCQIVGFAVGGIVVVVLGPTTALLANAGSFVASAVLIRVGVRRRPALARPERTGWWADTRAGVRYVFADPWLRSCLLLVWVASMVTFAPEAIAVPWADGFGGGPREAGYLLSAPAVGYTVGAVLLTRTLHPTTRDRMLVPAAVTGPAALVALLAAPPLPVTLALLAVAGAGAAFAAPLNAIFARRVEPAYRGRAMGVAISGLLAAQGVGFLAAGAAVEAGIEPSTVAGLAGVVGVPAVTGLALAWRQAGAQPHHRELVSSDKTDEGGR